MDIYPLCFYERIRSSIELAYDLHFYTIEYSHADDLQQTQSLISEHFEGQQYITMCNCASAWTEGNHRRHLI